MRKTVLSILAALLFAACGPAVPDRSSPDLVAATRSFYVGLAAMQAADDLRAKKELLNATRLASGEPAAWANLAVLQMRQKEFDASAASLEKAQKLAPANGQLYRNIYVLESQRGDFDKGVQALKKAIEIDPADVKAQFALGREYERQNNDAEAQAAYQRVSASKPANLAAKLEVARLTAKSGDAVRLDALLKDIDGTSNTWEPEIGQQFKALRQSAAVGNLREVSQNIAFFRNVLLRLPAFRSQIAEVRFDDTIIGEPFLRPLVLPTPNFAPAAPDETLKFTPQIVADEKARWCKAVYLDGDSAPVAAWANDKEVHIGDKTVPSTASTDVETIDIDYNFKNDWVVVGDRGVRFFDDGFQEITAKTKLLPAVLNRKYLKAFTFDVEIDGDLDLVLAAESGPPVVLQNNADGTFQAIKIILNAYEDLLDLASADIDEDGDMDIAILNKWGNLYVFSNERGGEFTKVETPDVADQTSVALDAEDKLRASTLKSPISEKAVSVAFADSNGDGKLDMHVVQSEGRMVRTTGKGNGKGWTEPEVIFLPTVVVQPVGRDPLPLLSALPLVMQDLDNNGAIDLATNMPLLNDKGRFRETEMDGERIVWSILAGTAADLNGDGRLDLFGLDTEGRPTTFINSGSKNYGWQIVRPRSAKAEGDQRVNSFGIGGEMEIRAGLLAQKRVISSPQVHFGLGEQTSTDMLRIVWGNGFIQAEFDMQRDQAVLVQQRLTGSCPHLFAWNGTEFKFVKDSAPLATSLGLRVSKTDVVPVEQTEEWYKIPGDQLIAKDGFYEIRITDELWESYYVDHYSLMAVDHPVNTEIYADEIYPIPSPLKLHSTQTGRAFASAVDDEGQDVAEMVQDLDEIYLDTFKKGRYQGVAAEHFVELELPADAPADQQIKIIADGWLHPTDTSLNVAISQANFEKPKTLSLDMLNKRGVWETVKDDFGVPASKFKTVVVDLPLGTKRCRLRTNSEVYWDRLAWAVAMPGAGNETTRIELSSAELAFHGFSAVSKPNLSSPEVADYETIATTIQRWRSIEGYYTRFGDIRELLMQPDDRYVLVTAGDEMRLRFAELPPVRAGFKRDFVIVGDGWIKEGDYNNVFSKNVLPLPTRLSSDYTRAPTRLEDDPVYQKHSDDWRRFHTRYVAPDQFRNALRNK